MAVSELFLESWPPPTNTVTYDLMPHRPKIATKMVLDHLMTPQRSFLNVLALLSLL